MSAPNNPKANTVRTLQGRGVLEEHVYRGNLLIALLDEPVKKFTQWEQGFIAALTMIEDSVDKRLAEMVSR